MGESNQPRLYILLAMFAVGTLFYYFGEVVDFFGMMQIPRAETLDHVHLHSVWTLGQVVANFRKHGMAPPEFVFF